MNHPAYFAARAGEEGVNHTGVMLETGFLGWDREIVHARLLSILPSRTTNANQIEAESGNA